MMTFHIKHFVKKKHHQFNACRLLIVIDTICIIKFVEEMLKSILLLLINLQERLVLMSLFTVFTGGVKHVRSFP